MRLHVANAAEEPVVVTGRGEISVREVVAWALEHRPDIVEAERASKGVDCGQCDGHGVQCWASKGQGA